ncbi:MAG: hypothetical protein AAF518_02740 [Spirochaetota bacterium]
MQKLLILVLLLSSFFSLYSKDKIFDPKINRIVEETYSLIIEEKYKSAKQKIFQCLNIYPKNFQCLIQLDIIYNCTYNAEDAQKTRAKILEIWNQDFKRDWIKQGRPIRTSTWARFVKIYGSYSVIGTEYFVPEVSGEGVLTLSNYYKIIMRPLKRNLKFRIFKLEMSNVDQKYYVLSEISNNGFTQIIPYGSKLPSFLQLMQDFEKLLKKAKL